MHEQANRFSAVCAQCKQAFRHNDPRGRKYCSQVCVHEALKRPMPECQQCGQRFRPGHHELGKFCSRPCADRGKIKPRRPRVCKFCGLIFYRPNAQPSVFCSRSCSRRGKSAPTPEQRFWRHVDKSGDCWVWTGSTNPSGYGHSSANGKSYVASRFSWELHNGPIPDGLFVCHKCDNRPCVRPDHLFLGTAKDNALDMVRKGRSTKRKAAVA